MTSSPQDRVRVVGRQLILRAASSLSPRASASRRLAGFDVGHSVSRQLQHLQPLFDADGAPRELTARFPISVSRRKAATGHLQVF